MNTLLLIEATSDAYRNIKKVEECRSIKQCLKALVNGSEHRIQKNIPDKIERPRSTSHLRNLFSQGNRYIHLSCHGDSSKLILPNTNYFDYDEFNSVQFSDKTELLFINACQVGRGPAAISALAALCDGKVTKKYVIAPLRDIYFETALMFSELFYDYLIVKQMSVVHSFKTATHLEGFRDLEYVCLDAEHMKEHYYRRGREEERDLQY